MKKLTREEAGEKIKEFFKSPNKDPQEVKKIKKLAMHYNIKLGVLRKNFCRKCFSMFPKNAKIRVKNRMKLIKCEQCNYISRWKMT